MACDDADLTSETAGCSLVEQEGGAQQWQLRINATCNGPEFIDAASFEALVSLAEGGEPQVRGGAGVRHEGTAARPRGAAGGRPRPRRRCVRQPCREPPRPAGQHHGCCPGHGPCPHGRRRGDHRAAGRGAGGARPRWGLPHRSRLRLWPLPAPRPRGPLLHRLHPHRLPRLQAARDGAGVGSPARAGARRRRRRRSGPLTCPRLPPTLLQGLHAGRRRPD